MDLLKLIHKNTPQKVYWYAPKVYLATGGCYYSTLTVCVQNASGVLEKDWWISMRGAEIPESVGCQVQ